MKLFFILVLTIIIAGISIPAIAQDTEKQDEPFSDALILVTQQLVGGLDWSTGYTKSLRVGSKQGVVLKASRMIYNIKFKSGDIHLNGDLIALKGENNDKDFVGLGFSANFKSVSLGIGYLPAGYGWSYTLCPFTIKF